MKGPGHACCGAALSLALAFAPGLARAADAAPAIAAAPTSLPRVDVVIADSFPSATIVAARVAGWFTGQGIATKTEVGPEPTATWVLASTPIQGVRIWITLGTPTTARVFFSVQERADVPPRVLLQEVELRSGVDELGIERLAQVASFSALAAWEGSAESTRRDVEQGLGVKPSPAAVTPAPRAVEPARTKVVQSEPTIFPAKPYWRFIGGFSYDTKWRGQAGTFVGSTTNAGASRRYEQNELSARLVLHVGFVPYSIHRDGARLQPNTIGGSLVLGAKHHLPGGIWFGAELEAARELVSPRMAANDVWIAPRTDSRSWSSWLGGGLGLGYEYKRLGVIGLFATVAVALGDQDYVVQDATTGEQHTLLSPWRVQPGLSLRTLF